MQTPPITARPITIRTAMSLIDVENYFLMVPDGNGSREAVPLGEALAESAPESLDSLVLIGWHQGLKSLVMGFVVQRNKKVV